MVRAFVAGWPISHSVSPHLHRFWMDRHGIAGSYEAIAVAPDEFPELLQNLADSGFAGGNVTIPHKEAAFRICSRLGEAAAAVGAVNTVWLEDGELWGDNTDIDGFTANLDERAPGWEDAGTALVLGAGGAARAVLHGLALRRIPRITLVNRTREKALRMAEGLGGEIAVQDWSDLQDLVAVHRLIVNTTSLGMSGQPDLAIDLATARRDSVVNDLVYNPLETTLLRQARRAGLTAVDGLGMLLHQAAPGFEKWFGVRPRVDDALRAHLKAVLGLGKASA